MKTTVKVNPPTKLPAMINLVIAADATGPLRVVDGAGREVGTLTVELIDPPPPPAKRTIEQMRSFAEICEGCEHLGPAGVMLSEKFESGNVDCSLCKSCSGKMSLASGKCKAGKW